MKHVLAILTLSLVSVSANAALLSRSSGQAYYDDVQNITWLADANASGQISFASAQAWITSLNATSYLGVNTWRLPTTLVPDPSCSVSSSSAVGTNCTGSEMGSLFNVSGITSASPVPFTNVQTAPYWSGTASSGGSQFAFSFLNGQQVSASTASLTLNAWAVSSGDIALVPIPPAVLLFGSALGLMGVMRRKISS